MPENSEDNGGLEGLRYALFWDIDGTLLTTGRAGIYAWEEATRRVTGKTCDFTGLKTAGYTDVQIAEEILKKYSGQHDQNIVRVLLREYEELLPASLPRKNGRVLDGVREILERLKNTDSALSLLLTGNTKKGARIKLKYYGLDSYFSAGAFAEDGPDRNSIARAALLLLKNTVGDGIPSENIYVIGDTPLDIQCGKAVGAKTVAVSTGEYSSVELAAHEPWCVMNHLPKPEEFINALLLK